VCLVLLWLTRYEKKRSKVSKKAFMEKKVELKVFGYMWLNKRLFKKCSENDSKVHVLKIFFYILAFPKGYFSSFKQNNNNQFPFIKAPKSCFCCFCKINGLTIILNGSHTSFSIAKHFCKFSWSESNSNRKSSKRSIIEFISTP